MNKTLTWIGFPYDKNSSYLEGTADAPPLIRKAFHCESSNYWTESELTLKDTFLDAGDIPIASNKEFESVIESSITSVLEKNQIPISLGGDHSITYPILKAIHTKYPDVNILHFDAHPDIYHDFDGNAYSHASPFARIMENGLAGRLVQVGIRTMSGPQRWQVDKFAVEVYEMKNWREDIVLQFHSPLYISFDMDALDPAFAPGVSHPEPGGLSTRQAIRVIQTLQAPAIIGADIVEYNPRRDPTGITAMVAAKLMKEIAARILAA
jgi:agmatinase